MGTVKRIFWGIFSSVGDILYAIALTALLILLIIIGAIVKIFRWIFPSVGNILSAIVLTALLILAEIVGAIEVSISTATYLILGLLILLILRMYFGLQDIIANVPSVCWIAVILVLGANLSIIILTPQGLEASFPAIFLFIVLCLGPMFFSLKALQELILGKRSKDNKYFHYHEALNFIPLPAVCIFLYSYLTFFAS